MPDVQRSGDWWRYYALRYFLGAIMGSALLFFIATGPEPWQARGTWLLPFVSSAPIREITALAALGFAFCYIASAPMLVLHSTRPYLWHLKLRSPWKFAVSALAGLVFLFMAPEYLWHKPLLAAGISILSGVVGLQVALIAVAAQDGLEKAGKFYRDLAVQRSKKAPIPEYVESYRHLREHGNAFAILAFEVLLAFVLYTLPRLRFAGLALLLWILPSSYSWFLGTFLERRMVEHPLPETEV